MPQQEKTNVTFKVVIILLFVNLLFSTVSIVVKYTSMQEIFSFKYLIGIGVIVLLLGSYAVVWQQILKRVNITLAYMFKATGIIYVLLYSVLLFGETLTVWNVIGAAAIVVGILLFVKS